MGQSAEQELVERFIHFYRDHYRQEIKELALEYPEKQSLEISWTDLSQFDSDLADDLISAPIQIREYAEEALRLYEHSVDVSLGQAHVRITDLPERTRLTNIRSDHLNTLISIYGTVDSTSSIESKPEELAFECQRCGTLSYIPQSGDYQEPHECQGCERQGPFIVNRDQSTYVDGQTIRVQERLTGVGTEDDIESVVVHLRDDLVDKVEPGDHVIVTGVLRREEHGEYNSGTIGDKYINTSYIELTDPYEHISLDEGDKQRIVELSNTRDIVERVIHSIAPSVHGYENIKLGIALQLFSGVPKQLPDDTEIRGDIHILTVGDPGTAKSVLLQRAAQLAPRAVQVSGKDTTAVGLTAAAAPSENSTAADPWSVEGGALVMANHGLACLDDFTNLSHDAYQSLHGVLEEQEINLSKATRTKTLPATTSVLAAGTPKYGRFDQYEPIAEQLDVSPGVLSQFDLVFSVTDQPAEEQDQALAEHVLRTNYLGELKAQETEYESRSTPDSDVERSEIEPEIESELLRKYIAYARRCCHPTLTEEARDAIKRFYVDIRSTNKDEGQPIPVTARKLEGIVRLAEANARMRLSDTVEKDDAERSIELVESSLQDVGVQTERSDSRSDAESQLDPETSEKDQMKELISDLEDRRSEGASMKDVLSRGTELGLKESKVKHLIDQLKREGEVYEPKQDTLRTT